MFAWMMSQGFIAPYLLERFETPEMRVGIFFAYFSTWWFLGGYAVQLIEKKLSSEKINVIPLYIVGFAVLSFAFIRHDSSVWIVTAISNFARQQRQRVSLGFLPME